MLKGVSGGRESRRLIVRLKASGSVLPIRYPIAHPAGACLAGPQRGARLPRRQPNRLPHGQKRVAEADQRRCHFSALVPRRVHVRAQKKRGVAADHDDPLCPTLPLLLLAVDERAVAAAVMWG